MPIMFCDTGLAARIERVETQLISKGNEAARARGTSGFLLEVAGGVASFAEADSPLNKVAGLGFAGVPDAADLDEVERAFAEHACPVQVELTHMADPAIGAMLTGRGYQLVSFENVLGRSLAEVPSQVTPPGIEVRTSGDDEFEQWLDVVVDGFASPDVEGVPSHEDFPRDVIASAMRDLTLAAGVTRYVALDDGVIAGVASACMADGVAQFTGAATAPAHHRRGIQSALLTARLAAGADAGCDVAVITTQPGSKSQQNAQRRGFDLLYTRAILVRATA
jgi:GNAT superfamily N-acetyltransferase